VHSSLTHHVVSLHLEPCNRADAQITRATLLPLHSLSRLTKLNVCVSGNKAAAMLLEGTTSRAAERLQSALPPSLHSFSFTTRPFYWETPSASLKKVASVFLAASSTMRHPTELDIMHEATWDEMRLDSLAASPLLRKLRLYAFDQAIPLSRLKGLSQLRELTLERVQSDDFVAMCQPPHALQRVDPDIGEEEEAIRNPAMEAQWTTMLRSVPILRRLAVATPIVFPFLTALSTHLPRLEQLRLCADPGAFACIVTHLSHPTLQQFEVESYWDLTSEQVHSLLHNPRLPRLRRIGQWKGLYNRWTSNGALE
jgi:hypothetical protein